jgi:hypothetical protein
MNDVDWAIVALAGIMQPRAGFIVLLFAKVLYFIWPH